MYGSYTQYRRDVKPNGYATFSCAGKDCRITMSFGTVLKNQHKNQRKNLQYWENVI